MRKPVVDYRELRLSRLTEPRFSHLLLLLGWVGYFTLYFLTENLIPVERCYPVHIWLDDIVPFCEWFVLMYVFWYVLIVISLGYFLLYNIENFRHLQTFIIVVQIIGMAAYILFPNRQDLRPEVMPRENVLTWIIAQLYAFDTSTNVCPSMHVAYSVGIASAWLKQKDSTAAWRAFIVIVVVMICLSTAFIKQHSVADIFAAIPPCIVAELWCRHRKKVRQKKLIRA